MVAVAYLRKSRSDDPTKEVSEDVQRREIEALAARDGVTVTHWYKDWDRSADESKTARRTEYAAMLREVESCRVNVIYAYAVDRLYRSLPGFLRLTDAAKRCGARIVTARDGVVGGDGSPMAAAFAQIGAVFTELELNTAKARARAAYSAREARGDHVGQIPYGYRLVKDPQGRNVLDPPGLERGPDRKLHRVSGEPPEAVQVILDAYVGPGCRRIRTTVFYLNDVLRIAAPYGGAWDRPSLLHLIEREAPHLLPPRTATGRRDSPATPALLAKLLRCHCGRLMTPNRSRAREDGSANVSYYCAVGNSRRSDHPRVYVAESFVLPFVKAEADKLRPDAEAPSGEDYTARRTALEEKRRRLALVFADGGVDEMTYHRERKAVDAELSRLEAASHPQPVPPRIDWEGWSVEDINTVLRAMFEYVQLDEQLQPVSAEWLVPEWRAS